MIASRPIVPKEDRRHQETIFVGLIDSPRVSGILPKSTTKPVILFLKLAIDDLQIAKFLFRCH